VPVVSWLGVQAARASRVITKTRYILKRSLTLEGVEELLAFVLGPLEAGRIIAVDEDAADGAADEGEGNGAEVEDHGRLGEFSEKGGDLGLELGDALGV
jgi:hypothetical protein